MMITKLPFYKVQAVNIRRSETQVADVRFEEDMGGRMLWRVGWLRSGFRLGSRRRELPI